MDTSARYRSAKPAAACTLAACTFAACTFAALVALGSVAAHAQSSQRAAPISFTRTVWHVSDGLPEDTVQALAESPDGMLWIGSTGGLARFGGVRMQTLTQPLSVNSIFCLTIAHDGSLWAGTEGGGLLHIAGDTTTVFSTAEGLADGFVRTVFEDDRQRLWVGTDNGLFRLRGNRLERIDDGIAMPTLAVHSITQDRQHRIWAGGSRLLAIDTDGAGHTFSLPGAYSENRVKKVLQAADGTIWVGTVSGLARLQNGRFVSVPGIRATVRSLLQTSDSTLWIGTIGDGLWTLRDAELSKVREPGLLPSDTVLSMIQDDQGQVWIGTQAGLVRLDRTPVSVIKLPNAGDPDFETIAGDDHGNLWVAAQHLYRISTDNDRADAAAAVKVDYDLHGVSVRNVFRAHDGALWIGTDGSGVYRIGNDTVPGADVTHFSAPGTLTNNFIRAFMETRDKTLWIATDEGVSSLGPHGAHQYTEATGLAYFSTRCLLEDRRGSIWIGTDRGLSEFRKGAFQQSDLTRALAHEKVWSILEDRQGTLWFGTRDHGLFRAHDGVLRQFTTEQGLPSNGIYQLLQDHRGTFWITGPNTIASVNEREMDAPASDERLSVTLYSMPFGAGDAQLYGGREPAGYLAPDDSVWFPTNRGVAHIMPALAAAAGSPPRAVINEVAEDGRAVFSTAALKLPASLTRLSFRFSAIYLRPQTQVRFRYRLENFDANWIVAGSDGLATYTNLKAGHYRFHVQTFDSSRPSAITEATVDLDKPPRLYETGWFYLGCAVLLALAAWVVYRLRLRQVHTRFAAVLEERSRLARELHDTVIQGCTGVSALLEAIASTSTPEAPVQRELLDYARQQTRATIDEARQVVWDMRHERENGVELIEAMQAYAAQIMREHPEIAISVQSAEPLWLRASAAHEMLMVVREAVYNAVQHSGTLRVEMIVTRCGDEIAIAIVDHGKGFPPDMLHGSPEGHYGIIGMRERVKRLNGNLEVVSAPGAGTTIHLRVAHAARWTTTERT